MSERERETGEESIDEEGRNPTQQRIDEEGTSEKPADDNRKEHEWTETEPSPHRARRGRSPSEAPDRRKGRPAQR